MRDAYLRKSRIAAGVFVICLLALMETAFAHHARPNPLSPLVWTVLGSVGLAALVASLWFKRLSRNAAD
jgi:peptidoglycan/LPS O-acetylase OafA/YrhL